jgi:hypothetical protein
MERALRYRPSPSLIIACLALIVALGGTAIGLPGKKEIDKNDLRKNVVKSKNVKDDSLNGNDVDEGSFGQVPSAANATNAATADGPLAYAHVNIYDGDVDETLSRGITDAEVSRQGVGNVCFDVPFSFGGAQVTPEIGYGANYANFSQNMSESNCPAGSNAQVLIINDLGNLADAFFFIEFYR